MQAPFASAVFCSDLLAYQSFIILLPDSSPDNTRNRHCTTCRSWYFVVGARSTEWIFTLHSTCALFLWSLHCQFSSFYVVCSPEQLLAVIVIPKKTINRHTWLNWPTIKPSSQLQSSRTGTVSDLLQLCPHDAEQSRRHQEHFSQTKIFYHGISDPSIDLNSAVKTPYVKMHTLWQCTIRPRGNHA